MSSDEENSALSETPDSEEEMRRIRLRFYSQELTQLNSKEAFLILKVLYTVFSFHLSSFLLIVSKETQMSSDEEVAALLETPDSEEEMRTIMTEVLQPRTTHPTEQLRAFPNLESALEFACHQLETEDQARTNEPPTQTYELSAMTDSTVITTERVPPHMGSIVPYEPPAMSEFDVSHTAGAELHPLLGVVEPCQIAVPVGQNQPAFQTHQLGESSAEPAKSHGVSAVLVDNYPVTPEDLDEFHAAEVYLWETTALPDFEISIPASEIHDLTASSLADCPPSNETPTNVEPDATEAVIYLPQQSTATSQSEVKASELSNLIDSLMAYVLVHTTSGAEAPHHRAVLECQNLSASPTHQHDESNTQPALESPDIAMNFTDSNPVKQQDLQALQEALRIVPRPSSPSLFDTPAPASPGIAMNSKDTNPVNQQDLQALPEAMGIVFHLPSPSFFDNHAPASPDILMNFTDSNPVNQQDLQALQEALSIVSQPSSPSFFKIKAPGSPDFAESPVAHPPNSRSLTDVEENAFQESLDPPHQPTATSQSQPSNI